MSVQLHSHFSIAPKIALGFSLSSGLISRDQVRNDRWPIADVEGLRVLFDLTICERHSLVLAQVFSPRLDEVELSLIILDSRNDSLRGLFDTSPNFSDR